MAMPFVLSLPLTIVIGLAAGDESVLVYLGSGGCDGDDHKCIEGDTSKEHVVRAIELRHSGELLARPDIDGVNTGDMPVWLAVHETTSRHCLYVALANANQTLALSVDPQTGAAKKVGSMASGGATPVYLEVHGADVLLVANYNAPDDSKDSTGAAASSLRIGDDCSLTPGDSKPHAGHSVNPVRQGAAHVHSFVPAPYGEHKRAAYACDLGLDAIFSYDVGPDGALGLERQIPVYAGSGPRHIAPHPREGVSRSGIGTSLAQPRRQALARLRQMAGGWSAEEQAALEQGLRDFAHVADQKEKWRGIASRVGTRSAKECALRFKQVREEVLRTAVQDEAGASGATSADIAKQQWERRAEQEEAERKSREAREKEEEERRNKEAEQRRKALEEEKAARAAREQALQAEVEERKQRKAKAEAEAEERRRKREKEEEAKRKREADAQHQEENQKRQQADKDSRATSEVKEESEADNYSSNTLPQQTGQSTGQREERRRNPIGPPTGPSAITSEESQDVANADRGRKAIGPPVMRYAEREEETEQNNGKRHENDDGGYGKSRGKGKKGKSRDDGYNDQRGKGRKGRKGGKDKGYKGEHGWEPRADEAAGEEDHQEKSGKGSHKANRQEKGKRGEGKGKGKYDRKTEERPDEVILAREASLPLRERIASQLKRGSYECMICISKVGKAAAIWSCSSCSGIFHLKCTIGWIKKSNEGSQANAGAVSFTWPCPGCRYIHVEPRLPEYTCFCARILEPELSPHWTPHSCGEACERKRDRCPHPCPELCHPGPCPPCTAVGAPGSCHCGREKKTATRCGEPLKWSCGEPCGKQLACGTHTCPLRCHTGKCPPCAISHDQSCFCGRVTERRSCGSEAFSCGAVCDKELECGHHKCERLCHPGDCGECRFTPIRWGQKCACGKTDTSSEAAAAMLVRYAPKRKSCADRLSLCGNICGRRSLSGCGHSCRRPCHEGPCGPCEVKVEQTCRCEQSDRIVDCFTATTEEGGVYLCKTRCGTQKSCRKHKCERLCCPHRGVREHEVHLCLNICGRPLDCGHHQCEDFCHLGNCPPCRVVSRVPLLCACGWESIEPPVRCGTAPPYCARPCGQEMDCGHTCRALCHFDDHPPCTELVQKVCVGNHMELPPAPCYVPAGSCGQPCGKPHSRCDHRCRKTCHLGDCPKCEEPCGAGRLYCEHHCTALCHPDVDCPDVPCTAKVRVSCKCGVRVEHIACGACENNKRPQHPNLPCGAGCRVGGAAEDRRRGDEATSLKFDAELARAAERAGVQFVRYLEQRLEELLPPARLGTSAVITLTKNDVMSGKRPVAVELGRVHYGFQHKAAGEQDGSVQLSFWAEASSSRRPPGKLSALLTGGGDVGSLFGSDAPTLRITGLPRSEEAAEELSYELLSEEEVGSFRLRFDGDGVAARFVSATAAALAFQRLTRQAASTDTQDVRRMPQDRAQRIARFGARPRLAFVGKRAAAALADVRQRSNASATGTTSHGGSAWGPKTAPASGSAWGRGSLAASAAVGSGSSAWAAGPGKGANAAAPTARAAGAAGGKSSGGSVASGSTTGGPAAAKATTTSVAASSAKASPTPRPVPQVEEEEVPDSWDD